MLNTHMQSGQYVYNNTRCIRWIYKSLQFCAIYTLYMQCIRSSVYVIYMQQLGHAACLSSTLLLIFVPLTGSKMFYNMCNVCHYKFISAMLIMLHELPHTRLYLYKNTTKSTADATTTYRTKYEAKSYNKGIVEWWQKTADC